MNTYIINGQEVQTTDAMVTLVITRNGITVNRRVYVSQAQRIAAAYQADGSLVVIK